MGDPSRNLIIKIFVKFSFLERFCERSLTSSMLLLNHFRESCGHSGRYRYPVEICHLKRSSYLIKISPFYKHFKLWISASCDKPRNSCVYCGKPVRRSQLRAKNASRKDESEILGLICGYCMQLDSKHFKFCTCSVLFQEQKLAKHKKSNFKHNNY